MNSLYNLFIILISALMPTKQLRKNFRNKYKKDAIAVTNKYYKKIYLPCYPKDRLICRANVPIYNCEGREMDKFFIRDRVNVNSYVSKYFLFDRYNIELNTHFYGHKAILEQMGNPVNKYALFEESESIIPYDYQIFKKHKGIEKDFDAVFTYSETLLETLPNAKFFPFCAQVWYYFDLAKQDKISILEDCLHYKTKNVSMMCSNKLMCPLHYVRHKFAYDSRREGVDIFGTFGGGKYIKYKSDSLTSYRYQIVIENDIKPYYFTEKIMDCFASMTVPIYLGAAKIGKFFNPDGIIFINKDTDISKIIKSCTEKEYLNRLPAVKDNYMRSKKYFNLWDTFYEQYFMNKKTQDGKYNIDSSKIVNFIR